MSADYSLKESGNELFKAGRYDDAILKYSEAISKITEKDDQLPILLCNRAASYLKLGNFEGCKLDCSKALDLRPSLTKAYFRRAQAYDALKDYNNALVDVSKLLQLEPKNTEAINMMRRIKAFIDKERADDTEINKILKTVKKGQHIEDGLKSMIGLCADNKNHSLDLYRKGGLTWIEDTFFLQLQIEGAVEVSSLNLRNIELAIRVLSAASTHKEFVDLTVKILNITEINESNSYIRHIVHDNHILWEGVCSASSHTHTPIFQAATALLLRILKALPYHINEESCTTSLDSETSINDPESSAPSTTTSTASTSKPESKELVPYLTKEAALSAINSWITSFQYVNNKQTSDLSERIQTTTEIIHNFLSENADYTCLDNDAGNDHRNESVEDRKKRMLFLRLFRRRAKQHATWMVDAGMINALIPGLDFEVANDRHLTVVCLGRIINALEDDNKLKEWFSPYLLGSIDPTSFPPIDKCRLRASLEISLLLARPELGIWALSEPGGISQLLLLISTADIRCQEVAAEVICLCASTENGPPLLTPIVQSNVLYSLMTSSQGSIRAAAASALTKLTVKAKALKEDSSELGTTLNVVLDVIKAATQSQPSSSTITSTQLPPLPPPTKITFSSVDLESKKGTTSKDKQDGNNHTSKLSTVSLTSTERAVEVLAALAGRTHIKEELVHGSYRIASAIQAITALALSPDLTSGSISYGLAHIFSCLSVTNNEIRNIALAEKGITNEQYQQLQELQRVKAKDDDGNIIEDPKEIEDEDNEHLCKLRVQKLVTYNVIPALMKLIGLPANKTKQEGLIALRQICVEPTSRGVMIQQGGLSACYDIANNKELEHGIRREAAHIVAKVFVTINPACMSEHLRLGAIKPLVYLGSNVESSFLQQFEVCLSITNLMSYSEADQNRFVKEHGINAIHMLMFSDHFHVRRAATEVFCNLSSHESFLKLLRVPDNIKLWVAFTMDWDNEENDEADITARAAIGTLAISVNDPEVAEALSNCKITEAINSLLQSNNEELIHRALVLLQVMIKMTLEYASIFLEDGVVPLLSELINNGMNEIIQNLVKETALLLSKTMKNT